MYAYVEINHILKIKQKQAQENTPPQKEGG